METVAGDPGEELAGPTPGRRDASESPWWLLLTPFLPALVALPGGAWALPLFAPLTVYAAFARRVRDRRYGAAWVLGMLWAALLSAGVIALTELRPAIAAPGILHGPDYREEMFRWIVTGIGKESTPSRFLPEHALHLVGFALLTVVSGGYLGLALGAFLTAYMSYFVGSYAAHSSPVTGALAAWVPWSIVRVASFVLLGALLARPLLVRHTEPRGPLFGRREQWLLGLALLGIVTDAVTKALLAPWWGHFLRHMLRR